MDLALFTRNRLKQVRLSPRDRARASNMAESYVAQRQRSSDRTHIDDQLERVLKLPLGQLAKIAHAEPPEHLSKRMDPPLLHRRRQTQTRQTETDHND